MNVHKRGIVSFPQTSLISLDGVRGRRLTRLRGPPWPSPPRPPLRSEALTGEPLPSLGGTPRGREAESPAAGRPVSLLSPEAPIFLTPSTRCTCLANVSDAAGASFPDGQLGGTSGKRGSAPGRPSFRAIDSLGSRKTGYGSRRGAEQRTSVERGCRPEAPLFFPPVRPPFPAV